MHRYRMHGLTIASEIELEAQRDPGARPVDLTLTMEDRVPVPSDVPSGDVVAFHEEPDFGLRHVIVTTALGWHIRFPRAAEVHVSKDCTSITAQVDPRLPLDLFGVLAAGFVVATVLQLRGELVLHASAVEVDGRGVAVVGPSGRGKSTTATLLCRAGARLVSDDVLRVDVTGSAAVAHQGPTSSRLRPKAAELALGGVVSHSADGRVVLHHTPASQEVVPIDAVLLPHPQRDLVRVRSEQLSGGGALVPLLSSPRILGWRDGGSLARQLQQLSALCSRAAVLEMFTPWGPPFAEDVGEQLIAELLATQSLRPCAEEPSTA